MSISTDHLKALTFAKVAETLSVSTDTVDRLCKSGRLRSISIGTGGRRKARRVLLRDLEAYIEAESGAPATPKKRRRRKDETVIEFIQ